MTIVEFNGLPGCGKSTVSDSFVTLCNNNDIKCIAYNEAHERMPRNPFKALIYVLKNWDIEEVRFLFGIARNVENNLFITKIKRVIAAEQICVNYRKHNSLEGIYVVDQGIVQAIGSILHTYKYKNKSVINELIRKILYKYEGSLFIVNTVASAETSKERIRYRNYSYGSRMNVINDDKELLQQLTILLSNLEMVRNAISDNVVKTDIDMIRTPEDNAEQIMRWIISNATDAKPFKTNCQ